MSLSFWDDVSHGNSLQRRALKSLYGDEENGYRLGHKRAGRIVGFGTEREGGRGRQTVSYSD